MKSWCCFTIDFLLETSSKKVWIFSRDGVTNAEQKVGQKNLHSFMIDLDPNSNSKSIFKMLI